MAPLPLSDLCVFEVARGGGLVLRELREGVALAEVRAKTGAEFQVAVV